MMTPKQLTCILAMLVTLSASSQVAVVAGERWNYLNCFFTVTQCDATGAFVKSHTAELREATNIPSMEVEEGDELRIVIHQFRPDGKAIVDKRFSVHYDGDYNLVAKSEEEINQVAIILNRAVSREQGWAWNWD